MEIALVRTTKFTYIMWKVKEKAIKKGREREREREVPQLREIKEERVYRHRL